MLYSQIPKGYKVEMEVAACMIESNWEILLVQRPKDTVHGWTWSEPWGKIDPDESSMNAMKREIFEETWLELEDKNIKFLFKKYMNLNATNVSIDFYSYPFSSKPKITINPSENCDYTWVTPNNALTMNLIEDFDIILKEIYL
jgi:8-oxo-dGTP pyrophosphatase MutT (NUDIX family)